jgi:hypothetical protein
MVSLSCPPERVLSQMDKSFDLFPGFVNVYKLLNISCQPGQGMERVWGGSFQGDGAKKF